MGVKNLADRANTILQVAQDETNALLAEGRVKEAKVVLTNAQRDLREVKREAADEQRQVREAATDARLNISGQGQTIGMFMGSKARGAMARSRANQKRDLARKQADALRPYDSLKSEIDRAIARLDGGKAEVTQAIADEKTGSSATSKAPQTTSTVAESESGQQITQLAAATPPTAAPASPPSLPPAQWARDPSGRHDWRYWDGTSWTEHVSDAGVTSTDPLKR